MRMLINLVAPVFALSAVALISLFPHPNDLFASVAPTEIEPVTVGATPDVQEAVANLADEQPAVRDKAVANADCFEGLDKASQDKLDRCGRVVIEILADVAEHQNEPSVQHALESQPADAVSERLRLVATEVCRAKWSFMPLGEFEFDNPACGATNISLVTNSQ